MNYEFKVGGSVICINDSPGWITKEKLLEKGKIYEVLSILKKDIIVYGVDGAWDKSRFRPLDELSDFTYEQAIEMIEKRITVKA